MFGKTPLMFIQKSITLGIHLRKVTPILTSTSRMKSTSSSDEKVVITDDGSTIVCWHPPKPFPYEFSRPIPEENVKPQNTILKVENKSDVYNAFKTRSEESTREELMKITHTTKHRWVPNNRRLKKTFKRIKSDREWL